MTGDGELRRRDSHYVDLLAGRRRHSGKDLRWMVHCYFGYYCYCWVLRSPVVLSLRRTTRTSFGVVLNCFCSCHRRYRGFGNPRDAEAECLLDAREAWGCPTGIQPVSYRRNRDRTLVRRGTGQRTDCGDEDCTERGEPVGTVAKDASQNRAFHPLDRSWAVAVASGDVE